MDRFLLLTCLGSTWFMTGLIWFVQIVHYPLFARVAADDFGEYHRIHAERTTRVVLLPMLVELLTAAGLIWYPPEKVGMTLPWMGLAAAFICWASTGLIQVPLHELLVKGHDQGVILRLVRSNLIRTVGWTVHGLIVLAMVAACLARN